MCRNPPLAIEGGGGPDKGQIRGLLLMIKLLNENHQPPYSMKIMLDRNLGHRRTGSLRGHTLMSHNVSSSVLCTHFLCVLDDYDDSIKYIHTVLVQRYVDTCVYIVMY